MSQDHSIEELCDCGYEVEMNKDWSDIDPGREYVACPLYLDEGFGCTYFRWIVPEGTKWQRDVIIRLEKEKQELKDEIFNLKRQIDDMTHRKEETERIMRKFKKQS
jgi:hypothetical protein